MRVRFSIVLRSLLVGMTGMASAAVPPVDLTLVDPAPPSGAAGAVNFLPVVSTPDGAVAVFGSYAGNLLTEQVDGQPTLDLFAVERASGRLEMLTRLPGTVATSCGETSLTRGRAISDDGRWVVFESSCRHLVPGLPAASGADVYLHDRSTGNHRLLSRLSGSGLPAGDSQILDLSADGRWIVLQSHSALLAPGATLDRQTVFLVDRDDPAGRLTVLGVGAPKQEIGARRWISDDGRRIVFNSYQPNPNPSLPPILQLFLHDRILATTQPVSRTPTGAVAGGHGALISGQGNAIVYVAPPGVLSNWATVHFDIAAQTHRLVAPEDRYAESVSLSADGRSALFTSYPDGVGEVLLWQADSGVLSLVDHVPGAPTQHSGYTGYAHALSADGRTIVFSSGAPGLVPGMIDANGTTQDLFVRDLSTGATRLLSARHGDPARTADGSTWPAALSADGQVVWMLSRATDLVADSADHNQQPDLFVAGSTGSDKRLVTRTAFAVERTRPEGGFNARMSGDGRWIAFNRGNTEAWLRDGQSGQLWLVNPQHDAPERPAKGFVLPLAVAPDGSWVLFQSDANDLVASYVGSGPELFRFERSTGQVSLITHVPGAPATALSGDTVFRGVSDDGRWLALQRSVEGSFVQQVLLYDREQGVLQLVSQQAARPGVPANGLSDRAHLSGDGRWLVFMSRATDLVSGVTDSNQAEDIYLFDRLSGSCRLVSHAAGAPLQAGNGASDRAVVSADGSRVFLQSLATDLAAGVADANQAADVLVWSAGNGQARLLTSTASDPLRAANAASRLHLSLDAALDGAGQQLLIESLATDLLAGGVDENEADDLFLFETGTSGRLLVSHVPGQPLQTASRNVYRAAVCGDGTALVVGAQGSALDAGAPGSGQPAVYRYAPGSGRHQLVSRPNDPGQPANDQSGPLSCTADGGAVLFWSAASNLLSNLHDFNWAADLYLARAPLDVLLADGFED